MAVRLPALRAGRPLTPGRFLVLISVIGQVDSRAIVRLEGLGKPKNPIYFGESNPRPSGLQHSTSNKYVTECCVLLKAEEEGIITLIYMSAGLAEIKLYTFKRRFSSMLKYLRSIADNSHWSQNIELHVFVMEVEEIILEEE
jgi:hypothetical protein